MPIPQQLKGLVLVLWESLKMGRSPHAIVLSPTSPKDRQSSHHITRKATNQATQLLQGSPLGHIGVIGAHVFPVVFPNPEDTS